ncbi:MAG: hypothetical protein P4L44_00090 [Oryzomonas sp.]|uniref:hypothetical protein n=1 Tax=Oryzomonas sp. TaxID=2855186 RepID=UPI00285200C2|nr:hypothetical protein [Oryzomonas sp.]MDR3578344.1 hypothetical protein [Oryzomonas sp.]
MKFDICKTLILAVAILGAGCGNLTEPNGFSFATQTNVPLNTNIQSNVVTIEGNQYGASIAFANASSSAYSQYSINGGGFSGGSSSDLLHPGDTLQLQQTTSSNPSSTRTTTITVGGFTTTFTTVTIGTIVPITAGPDANGNVVTISSISASLTAGNNVVDYSITANTNVTNNTSGISGNTIPAAFTLQAISSTGSVVYSTNASQVSIPFGQQAGIGIFSGALPTTATGNLPNAINGYPITTKNYWSSLISYWKIVPGSLTIQ